MLPVDSRSQWAQKLAEFELLAKGWDSYQGRQIAPAAIRAARGFLDGLEHAQLVPCPDGGVQIEWHVNGVHVEVTFQPNGEQE